MAAWQHSAWHQKRVRDDAGLSDCVGTCGKLAGLIADRALIRNSGPAASAGSSSAHIEEGAAGWS